MIDRRCCYTSKQTASLTQEYLSSRETTSLYDRYQNFSECKHVQEQSHWERQACPNLRLDHVREVRDVRANSELHA